MSLAEDLLEQARHLAERDSRRPKQASLRRAVSTAYYSLFHLLVGDAVARLSGSPHLRPAVRRAFEHREMREVAEQFGRPPGQQPRWLQKLVPAQMPPELVIVAQAFTDLQSQRHIADYDLSDNFDRAQVVSLLNLTEEAHRSWRSIRNDPAAEVFLFALLFGRRWNR